MTGQTEEAILEKKYWMSRENSSQKKLLYSNARQVTPDEISNKNGHQPTPIDSLLPVSFFP